jgi:hypothetical protein
VTFTGRLSGTFSATNSCITNAFVSPAQTLVLGNNTYRVQIGPFSPPGDPSFFERLFFPVHLRR